MQPLDRKAGTRLALEKALNSEHFIIRCDLTAVEPCESRVNGKGYRIRNILLHRTQECV